jgi:hypothetical protein
LSLSALGVTCRAGSLKRCNEVILSSVGISLSSIGQSGLHPGSPSESGKNEVMRIPVFGECRPKLAGAGNERTRQILAFPGIAVDLLDRPNNKRANGRAGPFRPVSQVLVKWLWNIDGGSNCHDIIM